MLNGGLARTQVGAQVGELVAGEGVGGFATQVEVDAADGQVHRRQAPGGGVGLLAEDGHVAELAAVRFDEVLALHEHAAAAAARVVDLAVVRRQHGHQGLDDAARRVELPTALAFGAGEHAQKVLVDLAQHVARLAGRGAEADGGHQVDQLAQLAVRQLGPREALVQDALELGVLGLDQRQGIVDALADVGLLGGGTQRLPARRLGHPEDIDLAVVVAVFQFAGQQRGGAVGQKVFVGRIGEAGGQLGALGLEGVGDVLDEDEAEHEVLVLGGVHVGAQLVGGGPERFFDVVEHGHGA